MQVEEPAGVGKERARVSQAGFATATHLPCIWLLYE